MQQEELQPPKQRLEIPAVATLAAGGKEGFFFNLDFFFFYFLNHHLISLMLGV